MKRWTDKEMKTIHDWYPMLGAEKTAEKLPGRSNSSIATKAFTMKLKVDESTLRANQQERTNNRAKEVHGRIDKNIRKYYPEHGARYVADRLGLDSQYVRNRAHYIGVTCTPDASYRLKAMAGRNIRPLPVSARMMAYMESRNSELEQLALYKPWRKDYTRELHEPCPL